MQGRKFSSIHLLLLIQFRVDWRLSQLSQRERQSIQVTSLTQRGNHYGVEWSGYACELL